MLGLGKNNPNPSNRGTVASGKTETPFHYLVDFSTIKDWQGFGLNRTLSNLKLETATQIKQAEMEATAKKEGRDYNQIMMFVVVGVIITVIGFVLITSFMNVTETQEDLGTCLKQKGITAGELAVCNMRATGEFADLPDEELLI